MIAWKEEENKGKTYKRGKKEGFFRNTREIDSKGRNDGINY